MEHTLAMIEQAHQGDKEAREKLVEENLGLVFTVVRRFAGRGCEMEDLVQIGSIGLLKAIDKFDQTYEVKFSTYAVPLIAGEIKRFLRDDGMIKVSRTLKETAVLIYSTKEAMEKRLGRDPAMEELEQLLQLLEDQERRLIDLRYFCDKTQMETARELGISQVQVSRMEKRILQKMRGNLGKGRG